jgi:hypothetical protein
MSDYPLKRLDMSFIEKYDLYLRVEARLCTGSMAMHIIFLRKMAVRAMNQRILLFDPFAEFAPVERKSQYRHISKEELRRIMTTPVKFAAVGFIRDMFVFSCFTGLAYADICRLSEKHLHRHPDGSVWKPSVKCRVTAPYIPRRFTVKSLIKKLVRT